MFSVKKQTFIDDLCKNTCMAYGKRLEQTLEKRTKNRAWLAKQLDVTVQAAGSVIRGKTIYLKAHHHKLAVKALEINGFWLATGADEMLSDNSWPFTLFSRTDFARLTLAQQEMFENEIAGAILRLQKAA